MSSARRTLVWILTVLGWLATLVFGGALLVEPPGPAPVAGVRNADLHELPGSDDEPWSVVLLSDVQNGASYIPELFKRAESWNPRAIVLTGDLAPDSKDTLAQIPVWYLRRWGPPAPLFIVPGNHDLHRNEHGCVGEREFVQWYGSTTFEFRIGRTVFLGLDNSTEPIVGDAFENARERLENARARGERTIVCLHRNIVPFDEPNSTAETAYRPLRELLRGYDVPYVLCGHLHQESYDTRDGTRFVAVPASGHRPANETGQKPIGFMVLRWTGTSFDLQQEEFYRRNSTELKGVYVYLSLAKIRPMLASVSGGGPEFAGACVLAAVAGTGLLLRRRKGAS